MKKLLITLFLSLCIISCTPSHEKQLESTVVVYAYENDQLASRGSGVITEYGIITAAHVIKGFDSYEVRYNDGTTKETKVEKFRFEAQADIVTYDIALLTNPKEETQTAPIQCTPVTIQETVYAVGHPQQMNWVITKGNITSTHPRKNQRENAWIHTDAVFSRGSSGGPVFNRFNEVVGILSHLGTTMVQRRPIFTGFGYAVSGPEICDFVNKKQIPSTRI